MVNQCTGCGISLNIIFLTFIWVFYHCWQGAVPIMPDFQLHNQIQADWGNISVRGKQNLDPLADIPSCIICDIFSFIPQSVIFHPEPNLHYHVAASSDQGY